MARLPGVRAIDRYAQHFSPDSRGAVQEIYNNLGSNVALSEIYIVPRDLDPDKIDTHTHKPQMPITTYDHLIINHNAEKDDDKPDPVPEIEIYEYRLERQQPAQMANAYPTERRVDGLNYPAIIGQVPITCDNSRYSPEHPDDRDRAGLVYSVPFFAPDGVFKGSLTGVILTHAFHDLLPSGSYVLRNTTDDYSAVPNSGGAWEASRPWITRGQPNPRLLYSETLLLSVADQNGHWLLWCGQLDSVFWGRSDVRSARQFSLVGYAAAVLMTLGLLISLAMTLRNRRQSEKENHYLVSQVSGNSKGLSESSSRLTTVIRLVENGTEQI